MWFTGAVSWIWRGMSGEFIRDKRRLEYEVTLHCYSRFTQTHKIGNIAIIAEFVFPSVFAPKDIDIYNLDIIKGFQTSLFQFGFIGIANWHSCIVESL